MSQNENEMTEEEYNMLIEKDIKYKVRINYLIIE
jgi:hypothetical protein